MIYNTVFDNDVYWGRCGVLNYLIGPIKLIRSVKKTTRGLTTTATAVSAAAVAADDGDGVRVGRGRIGGEDEPRGGRRGRAPIIRNSCKRCGLTALRAAAVVCSVQPSCLSCTAPLSCR